MKISEFSIKHPVVITMCIIVLAVFGLYSVTLMPAEFMADISMPQAIVYTVYPGASAEDVEQDVTKILEDNFVTLPNFRAIDSSSYNSFSWITITYADGHDVYDQLQELRNRISELMDQLPSGIQGEPVAVVGGMSMLPVMAFSVEAGNDSARVYEYIKKELTPQLTQIEGVSEIQVVGDKELQIDIKIDVEALTSKGISVATVYQVLNYGNVSLPLGNATYQDKSIQVRYAGGFNSVEDIENLPVGVADGTNIIRIKDVAKVSLSYPKEDYYITDGENPLMIVNVTKRTDGNTLKIIKEVKAVLEKNKEESGNAIDFHIIADDSKQIITSLKTVIESGVLGVVFAVLVILLFLADWRATLTISLSIPLCILFSLIGLKVFNLSINLMSLSGLVISLGMVVDASSVMLDQIYRYYAKRNPAGELEYTVNQSINKGWGEVAASILASAATTIVVFLPISMLTGLIGNVLRTVSITIIMAIFASFVVAIVIVPYLLKLLLKDSGPTERTKKRKFDIVMEKIEAVYKKMLSVSLKNKPIVIISAIFLLILSGLIALRLGIAFIPSTDSSEFYVSVDFPIGTKLEKTAEKMEIAEELMFQYIPEIENVVFYVGQSNSKGIASQAVPECAYAHVILVPVAERDRSVHEIMLQIQEILDTVLPDGIVSVQNGGFDKLVGYASGGGGYGLTLISEDLNLLYETASKLKTHLEKHPHVVTAKLDTDFDTSTMIIDMSQEYLSSLGISSYEAGLTAAILFQGMDAGRYKDIESGNRFNIHLSSDILDKDITPDSISNLHIITSAGTDVSFASLSDIKVEKSVSQINHSDRAKTITVSAALVSENTAEVSSYVNEYLANNPLPSGVSSKTGGIVALIGDMVGPMAVAMVIAVFLVYTVMVLQFEKFKQPFLIMGSIPFCFIGAVIGLLVFGSTVNMLSLLGLITLSGIVVNNGIILVDYINLLRQERREEIARERGTQNRDGEWEIALSDQEEDDLTRQCILDGASSRLRPILITTLTTLLGDIPMAISKGEGAEIYAPMGQVIIGGLLSSTLITLIIIPVLYEIMEKKKKAKKSI